MQHILIDLDGTLTDTNGVEFDLIKSGRDQGFDVSRIPLLPGARSFINSLKAQGYDVVIVSDSHEAYVARAANSLFDVKWISLADKPNITKLKTFLEQNFGFSRATDSNKFVMVGDNRLDVHLARGLGIPSIMLELGLGDDSCYYSARRSRAAHIKEGATYFCRSYNEILAVLSASALARLALEDPNGLGARRFLSERNANGGVTLHRALGRQAQGLCDSFSVLQLYRDFQSDARTLAKLNQVAEEVSRYLNGAVLNHSDQFSWDLITCVADKATTRPANKMIALLGALDVPIRKTQLFSWKAEVVGSIRNHKTTEARRAFVDKYVDLQQGGDLRGKSVVIIDDQYTTGATADSHCSKLLAAGAKNVLFVALFYLTSDVATQRACPICDKPVRIRYRKSDGIPFYSCVPKKYNGNGCGWIAGIPQNERTLDQPNFNRFNQPEGHRARILQKEPWSGRLLEHRQGPIPNPLGIDRQKGRPQPLAGSSRTGG